MARKRLDRSAPSGSTPHRFRHVAPLRNAVGYSARDNVVRFVTRSVQKRFDKVLQTGTSQVRLCGEASRQQERGGLAIGSGPAEFVGFIATQKLVITKPIVD